MIQYNDKIWIGNSDDEQSDKLCDFDITAILNVANDLSCKQPCLGEIEYAQVGLIDGPGNSIISYYAAILTLSALIEKHITLVCCHSGSRALTILTMYLHLIGEFGLETNTPTIMFDLFSVKVPWTKRLDQVIKSSPMMTTISLPHESHEEIFDKMDWRTLAKLKG